MPLCSVNPKSFTQLVNKNYVDDNFVAKTTVERNIGGNKTFLNNVSCNGNLTGSIIQSSNYRGANATAGFYLWNHYNRKYRYLNKLKHISKFDY